MIKVLIVGGSRDGDTIEVNDRVDFIELIPLDMPLPRFDVAGADKPTPNLTFNIERYRINRYRGIATLC